MKFTEAIKRLGYTIQKQNKPNNTDAEALNVIIDFVNKSNKQAIQENLMFAKCYVFLLKEFLVHYKNIDFASKMINKDILKVDLSTHIENLAINLRSNELSLFFSSKGITDDTSFLKIDLNKLKEIHNTNREILKSVSFEEIKSIFEMYDNENTTSNVEMLINLTLKEYQNV